MSAFVVRNGAEPGQPVAPHKKAVAKPIDFPVRSHRYGEHSALRPANVYFEINPSPAAAATDDDDDLQFAVDDVAAPFAGSDDSSRAYSRAVFVPFTTGAEVAAPKSALEGKVEQLVSDFCAGNAGAAAAGALTRPEGLESLAAHLRGRGLRVAVVAPPKPSARAPLSTRSIDAPFLIATAIVQPADDAISRDGSPSDQSRRSRVAPAAAASAASGPEIIVVDAAVRDYLALAPATPSYAAALEAALPLLPAGAVFVGSAARLARCVAALAPAISAAFAAAGMEVPPWRRTAALQHRWSGVEGRRRQMEQEEERAEEWEAARQGKRAAAGAPAVKERDVTGVKVPAPPATAAAWEFPERDHDGDLSPDVVLRPLRRRPTAAAPPPVPVLGFEVGAAALGRAPWLDGEAGAFSFGAAAAAAGGTLFRRASQAESDDGSASAVSDEAILGMSPVSVFRDGCEAVPAACK